MCQSHTGRLTGLWFLPKPAFGLNTNDDDDDDDDDDEDPAVRLFIVGYRGFDPRSVHVEIFGGQSATETGFSSGISGVPPPPLSYHSCNAP